MENYQKIQSKKKTRKTKIQIEINLKSIMNDNYLNNILYMLFRIKY